MSLPILTISDFTGRCALANNRFTTDKVGGYITEYEKKYIRDLLNDAAYVNILTATPKSQFTALINGCNWVDDDGVTNVLTGLKDFLKKVIFYHIKRDNHEETVSGGVKNMNENSERLTYAENQAFLNSVYNEAITAYHAEIVPFINYYDEIEETITGFTDNGDNTYTINIPSTLYLNDGDTVSVNGTEYSVSNLVDDTSFDIDAGAVGLTFSGKASWKPFEDMNLPNLKTIYL